MYYNSFLLLSSQLIFEPQGKVFMHGLEVYITSFQSKASFWEIKVQLQPEDSPLSSDLSMQLENGRRFYLNSQRIYLEKREGKLFLIKIHPSCRGYLEYKSCMEEFFLLLSLF